MSADRVEFAGIRLDGSGTAFAQLAQRLGQYGALLDRLLPDDHGGDSDRPPSQHADDEGDTDPTGMTIGLGVDEDR